MKRALILGRASCLWDDIKAAEKLATFDTIIAVKRIGRDYDGPVHHWVSFHPNMFMDWIKKREAAGRPPAENYWSSVARNVKRDPVYPIPIKWLTNIGGSSGLLGVQVALEVIDKAVLCGIPMEPSEKYDDGTVWDVALAYRQPWNEFLPKMEGRIKSMSGWTRELLGAPTRRWLNDPVA